MQLGPGVRRILRWPASRGGVARDIETELDFHLETRVDALVAEGLSREAARAKALAEFGDLRLAREELRRIDLVRLERTRRGDWWSDLAQDLRFAWRSLRRQPSWLAVALLTLALGIGANAAIFSVVNAVLLRPLPFPDPDRLVSVWSEGVFQKGIYAIFAEETRAYDAIAGYTPGREVSLTGEGAASRLVQSDVTPSLFEVLGARPMLGRRFEPGEMRPAHDRVVILSHSLWRDRFASNPGVIGRPVTIDGVSRTVVGVMPADFHFPSARVQLWTPALFDPSNIGDYFGSGPLYGIGRLGRGVTAEQARAEAAVIIDRSRSAFPWRMPDAWGKSVSVSPLQAHIVGAARPTLLLLLGAVGLVLLVACVNVANLFLARASSRERELAIRAALGAGRGRVVRQLLTESVLLGVMGGAAGLALAFGTVRVLVTLLPAGTPRIEEIGVDGAVLAFTAVLALLTGIGFGLAPALRASRPDLRAALADGTRAAGGSRARRRFSEALVVAQVALAVVLVVGAGLLIRSFWLLRDVDPGFRSEHVIAASLPLPSFAGDTAARSREFYDAVVARVRAIPGVRAAAVTSQLPFASGIASAAMEVEAHPTVPGDVAPTPEVVSVTPDYIAAMGIPLLAGRNLTDADREGSSLVTLIDEVAAKQLWPSENAIGQRIRFVWLEEWITVVGVVGAVKRDSLNASALPSLYRPMRQGFPSSMRLVARAESDPVSIATSLRSAVAAVDANVPVSDIRALDDLVSASAARPRFTMLLLAAFAGLALLLGAVGIYGVIAFGVARRTREIGVRMALGAESGAVLRMVLREGGTLALIGVIVGLAGAFAASRVLAGLLYGVTPNDPAVFIAVPLLLAMVAIVASLIPARRASRVDPLVALRAE